VQADGADGGERGQVEVDRVRNWRDQVHRHAHDLRVRGVAAAGAGDAVAHAESFHALARADDDPGARVAEGRRLVQAGARRRQRRQQAVGRGLVQDLFDEVRPGACLGEQALPGELDAGALGAGGDERRRVAHEDHAAGEARSRHVGHRRLAARRLEELLHRFIDPGMRAARARA
jgi:hypothetical protein